MKKKVKTKGKIFSLLIKGRGIRFHQWIEESIIGKIAPFIFKDKNDQ